LASDLLDTFLADLPSQWHSVNDFHATGAWGKLREIIHKMHGATTYCGLSALEQALGYCEQAIQKPATAIDPIHVHTCIKAIEHEIRRLLAYLHEDRPIG
jgi:HPt (histidine-containing phosphotransfer) domain-containing protein